MMLLYSVSDEVMAISVPERDLAFESKEPGGKMMGPYIPMVNPVGVK